jgi:tetratricopeptide (TPR) repeat protein
MMSAPPWRAVLMVLSIAFGALTLAPKATVQAGAALVIDAERQFTYAQSRLDAGAADEAVAEFNRFIHFFPDDPRVPQARYQIGTALYAAGRYREAAGTFDTLSVDYAGSGLAVEAYFMLSRSHARQGMREQAMLDLHNLMALTTDAALIDRIHFEMGWLYIEQGRWDLADRELDRITTDGQAAHQVPDLRRALSSSATISSKNPTTAGILSIVPGGGQLYTGRYRDAVSAFLINAGLIWAAWESFDNELYALGGVISFVGFGFYAGNIYGAVSGAHKYNRDRKAEFRDALYRFRQPPLAVAPITGGAALRLTVNF